ncbi:MAG: hypothetical protein GXY77_04590 [Fibrobacter sp.]|nr:hypothetical protein [Fibrobacter sp.]
MKLKPILSISVLFLIFIAPFSSFGARFNGWGYKFYSSDTKNFRIYYPEECTHLVKLVAEKLEQLHDIYHNTYGIKLPERTNVVLLDSDFSNGWALANTNTITLWTHDSDFNLRGSHDWFDDVITHEYAHIVSINAGFKLAPSVSELRFGYFSHPNEQNRTEALISVPTDIFPLWFTEGIAQYESSRHGADSWDTHRDMILRTLAISDNILSWDQMQVFSGSIDNYEKTYNHGFALVSYIAKKYGYDKVVSLARESAKMNRFNFDKCIKAVLGIEAKELYKEWKIELESKYKKQISEIGKQVYGKKISPYGFENFWPKFSPDGNIIYYLSNGKSKSFRRNLMSIDLCDSSTDNEDKNRIHALPVKGFYDINHKTGRICYVSPKGKESQIPANKGGLKVQSLFTDTLPGHDSKFKLFSRNKKERCLTEQKSVFGAAFSPSGDKLALAYRNVDRFFLALIDSSGENYRVIYPDSSKENRQIEYIYSLEWSPDGKQVAFSFFDNKSRKIGVYDTLSGECRVFCNFDGDERDPSYSPDGKYLYFSSDRTGIFNIYRYDFEDKKIEQITNVSGGAFTPSVSPDNLKLVYSGYDQNGYSIYLLDSITAIGDIPLETAVDNHDPVEKNESSIVLARTRRYHPFPNQPFLSPILLAEQIVTEPSNANKGKTSLKAGLILNLIDPLTLSDYGSQLGAYFFMEPQYLFKFFTSDGTINTKTNYDLGVFCLTQRLPLTVSVDYMLRGVADVDTFFNETELKKEEQSYNIQLHNLTLLLTHYLCGSGGITGSSNSMKLDLIFGLDRYDVNLLLDGIGVFKYNMNKGLRTGAMSSILSRNIESENISPRGFTTKLQYDFWNQYSIKEEDSFDSSAILKELYDTYHFHQISGHTKLGISAPWYNKHDIHLGVQGSFIKVAKQDTIFPSFLLPGAWLPGYSYYYRDTKIKSIDYGDTTFIEHDTLLITGKAILSAEASYRFPLWPNLIDKKFGFLYLEYLYGAINFAGGAGWDNPMDIFEFDKDDWLLSFGLELRLQTLSFSNIPMDFSFRWDRGLKDKNIGGNRLTFTIGYDFDNWDYITMPDYSQKYHRKRDFRAFLK